MMSHREKTNGTIYKNFKGQVNIHNYVRDKTMADKLMYFPNDDTQN